jgi:nitroreductase
MLETINTRRSVRKWKKESVKDTDITEILEAAMNAPSAGNEQAWHFIVITDKEIMEKYSAMNRNVVYMKNAAAAILVCGNINAEKYEGLHVYDCSAATQNILLAIHSKELGAVWGHVFTDKIKGIQNLLELPEHIVPFSIVPFGYIEKKQNSKSRYDELKVSYNKWSHI